MNSEPIVSVVIPSLNQGEYIKESIDSVLGQTYHSVECIVADGGSQDGTIPILKSYGKRIRWISEKDKGQSNAINKGISMSTGEICGWLCSDDILFPNTVQKAVDTFAQLQGTALVYGEVIHIDKAGRRLLTTSVGEVTAQSLLNHDQRVVQPGSFYLRNAWNEVGGLDEALHFAMDYDLFVKLLMRYNGYYFAEPLGEFRMHEVNKSAREGDLMFPMECFRVGRRYGARIATRLNYQRIKAVVKYSLLSVRTRLAKAKRVELGSIGL